MPAIFWLLPLSSNDSLSTTECRAWCTYYHSGGDCTSSTPPKTWKWLGQIWYEKHDDHRMRGGIVISIGWRERISDRYHHGFSSLKCPLIFDQKWESRTNTGEPRANPKKPSNFEHLRPALFPSLPLPSPPVVVPLRSTLH